mgnify:CR=1 FL=1
MRSELPHTEHRSRIYTLRQAQATMMRIVRKQEIYFFTFRQLFSIPSNWLTCRSFILMLVTYIIVVNDEIFSRKTETPRPLLKSFLLYFNIFLKNVISTLWIFYAIIIIDAGNAKEVDQQSVEWMKKKNCYAFAVSTRV